MIKSFVDKETEKVYNQIFSKKLPQTIQRIAFVSIFNTAFVLMLMEMISLMLKLWTIIRKSVYTEIKSERKAYLWNILQLLQ